MKFPDPDAVPLMYNVQSYADTDPFTMNENGVPDSNINELLEGESRMIENIGGGAVS